MNILVPKSERIGFGSDLHTSISHDNLIAKSFALAAENGDTPDFPIYSSYSLQVGPLVIKDDDKLSPELQNAIEHEVKRLIKVKLILIHAIVSANKIAYFEITIVI
jgi:hypothetical protein